LVFPFELQGNLVERSCRMPCEQEQASGNDKPRYARWSYTRG
jgi:hypothetical protein